MPTPPPAALDLDALTEALSADPRIDAAWLFGSRATGRARPDSDVDLAYIPADDDARAALQADLLTLLGRLTLAAAARQVQLIDLPAAGSALRRQVFRDGHLLFDHDPARTTALLEKTMLEYVDEFYYRRIQDEALARRFPTTPSTPTSTPGHG